MERTSYYFTLGQSHVHKLENVTWDKDGVVEVQTTKENKAREFIQSIAGQKWGFCYDNLEKLNLEYYPKGIIKIYKV